MLPKPLKIYSIWNETRKCSNKKNEERGVGVLNHLVYIEYSEKILKQKKIANKQIHKQIFSRIKHSLTF